MHYRYTQLGPVWDLSLQVRLGNPRLGVIDTLGTESRSRYFDPIIIPNGVSWSQINFVPSTFRYDRTCTVTGSNPFGNVRIFVSFLLHQIFTTKEKIHTFILLCLFNLLKDSNDLLSWDSGLEVDRLMCP